MNKEERKIRIHSLKKKNNVLEGSGSKTGVRGREASNVKNKTRKLIVLNEEMMFRNTEIGFKRLNKMEGSGIGVRRTLNTAKSKIIV